MRRRLGLVAAILSIVVVAGYTALWWYIAGRIETEIVAWAQAVRSQGVTASWQGLRVAGYPLAFRVEATGLHLADTATTPPGDLRVAQVAASTRPWNFRFWRIAAPDGLSARAGPEGRPVAAVTAQAATGWVEIFDRGPVVWLELSEASANAATIPDGRVTAESAALWVMVPAQPPRAHGDRNIAVAVDLHRLAVPAAPPLFGPTIDNLAFGVTLMGPIPAGPPRQAAAAWRDDGGTVELDRFHLAWGALGVAASGTLALDRDLQPIGGFSGTVAGYDELLAALVSAGRLKAGDARLARVALAMVSKAGADGRSEISTSFTIQNGNMYFGPAKLGPAPRIAW